MLLNLCPEDEAYIDGYRCYPAQRLFHQVPSFCHSSFSPTLLLLQWASLSSAGYSLFHCYQRTEPEVNNASYCFGSTMADTISCKKLEPSFSWQHKLHAESKAYRGSTNHGGCPFSLDVTWQTIQHILHNNKLKQNAVHCLFEVWFGGDAEQKVHEQEKHRNIASIKKSSLFCQVWAKNLLT